MSEYSFLPVEPISSQKSVSTVMPSLFMFISFYLQNLNFNLNSNTRISQHDVKPISSKVWDNKINLKTNNDWESTLLPEKENTLKLSPCKNKTTFVINLG